MPSRRDFVIGGTLLALAAGAEALTPRRRMSLLGDAKLDALLPHKLPGWDRAGDVNVIAPPPKGSLADRLYSQQAQRIFVNAAGEGVMLLIAYGDTQSDQLQLHRPESCYPAVGFEITRVQPHLLALATGREIPVRELTAQLDQRQEQILYWTRLGEYLPASAGEQREVRLRNALAGIVSDGVLVRVSTLNSDAAAGSRTNQSFIRTFISAASPELRRALLGSAFAARG